MKPHIFRQATVALIACFIGLTASSRADVFILKSGGKVTGRRVNAGQKSAKMYIVETSRGSRLTLAASQVKKVVRQNPSRVLYPQKAATTPITVKAQWELAEWCREKGLKDERKTHLRKIIELEPNHDKARYGLGYSQVRGQWTTQEEFKQKNGYKLHDGKWLMEQEVALLNRDRKLDKSERGWMTKLRRWREMLTTPEKAREAYENILAVRDAFAIRPIAQLLKEEAHREVKLLYVEVLGKIANRPAVQLLVHLTLYDPDEEVFYACLKDLTRLSPPNISKRYIDALRDKNNVRINRAAHVLGELGESSAISPLIDALTTTHYIVLPKQQQHAYNPTFVTPVAGNAGANPSGIRQPLNSSPYGGTAFSAGDKPSVIPRTVDNEQVLNALVKLCGTSFGYNKQAWKYWLANSNQRAGQTTLANARRDKN